MKKTTKNKKVYWGNSFRRQVGLILLACMIAFTPTVAWAADEEWESLGSPGNGANSGMYNSLVMDGSTPYVAFLDKDNNDAFTVKRYSSSSWETVTTPLPDINHFSFALSGSIPYVAAVSNDYKLTVKRYSGGSWETVGGIVSSLATVPTLAFNGSTPYVSFSDHSQGGKTTVATYNNGSWETVGQAGFSSGNLATMTFHPSLAFDGPTPYVVFNELESDDPDDAPLTVMRYNGTTWETVGQTGFTPAKAYVFPHLAINNSIPYVSALNGETGAGVVMRYTNGTWETLGDLSTSAYPTLAFVGSTPYIAAMNMSDGNHIVKRYNGITWETVGNYGAAGIAMALARSGSSLYALSFNPDGNSPLIVKRYDTGEGNGAVTLPNAENGKLVELAVPNATTISSSSAVKESTLTTKDNAYDYPVGLVNFRFATAAASNTVSLVFVTDLKLHEVVARKYNPTTKEYAAVPGAAITETTYDDHHALQVTYTIADNGPLDLDPALGIIDDPVGLAVLSTPGAPNTGVGRDGISIPTVVIIGGIVLGVIVGTKRFRQRKRLSFSIHK